MARHVVARVSDIPERGRIIVELQGRSVGIFRVRGRFYAVLNRCPHKGAELCRGSILGHLTASAPGELRYDPDRTMIQCPWHGWEYDLRTGEAIGDPSRIRPFQIEVEDGEAVAEELQRGAATATVAAPGMVARGFSGPKLEKAPFVAETFPISVQDDYVVVDLPGGAETRELVVREVVAEAEDVVSLRLVDPDGARLPVWSPGAHVDLVLAPGLERQYSLCGDTADPDSWRVAVLREPEGRGGSAHVHEHVRPGDRLTVRGPRNHFPLVDAERHLLIAGGIGITPLLAMIAELERRGADWRLVYGGRSAATQAFTGELARHGDRVTLWPQDTHGLLPLDDLLGTPEPGTAVYCCGPEALLAAVEARCAAWPEGALHVERFAPRPGALDGVNVPFEVVLARTGTTVPVAADESIADALRAAGVTVATSCKEGTCGTCETRVLAGTPDHRDSLLTDAERERGDTMMVCCSRAHSDTLTLDL